MVYLFVKQWFGWVRRCGHSHRATRGAPSLCGPWQVTWRIRLKNVEILGRSQADFLVRWHNDHGCSIHRPRRRSLGLLLLCQLNKPGWQVPWCIICLVNIDFASNTWITVLLLKVKRVNKTSMPTTNLKKQMEITYAMEKVPHMHIKRDTP